MIRNNLFLLLFISLFNSINVIGQNIEYARNTVKKLSSKKFFGRGYTQNGDFKAAAFIAKELQKQGIDTLPGGYFQEYSFPVNTYPGKVLLKVDNRKLKPGSEFTFRSFDSRMNGTYEITKLDTGILNKNNNPTNQLSTKFGYYDTIGWGNKWYNYLFRSAFPVPYKGTIQIVDQTPASGINTRKSTQTSVIIKRDAFPITAKTITLDVENKYIQHNARNVIGILKGKTDTFIIFSAHYDHLGGFGKKAFFPGANDNASGTAMVLDIARELSQQTESKYSYAFIFFSGEEAGLLGSYYFTDNPLIPLSKIKTVINIDMVATGADGLSVFNGTEQPQEFATLDSINKKLNLNIKLLPKKLSRNNDLYPFYKSKVKGFTFLTEEKNAPYHTVTDTYNNLSFMLYEETVKLIQEYIKTL